MDASREIFEALPFLAHTLVHVAPSARLLSRCVHYHANNNPRVSAPSGRAGARCSSGFVACDVAGRARPRGRCAVLRPPAGRSYPRVESVAEANHHRHGARSGDTTSDLAHARGPPPRSIAVGASRRQGATQARGRGGAIEALRTLAAGRLEGCCAEPASVDRVVRELALQVCPQRASRAIQTGAHGAHGKAEAQRDGVVLEAVHLAEKEYGAMRLG